MELISRSKPQYKANLHCHSTLSDGYRTVAELKELYRAQGYSILAVTDHEYPASHAALTDADFLMLTGYEVYIRPNPKGIFDPYQPEVHLNLFARDPYNTRLICPNGNNYCRYREKNGNPREIVGVGSEAPRQYTVDYVNAFIRTALENGYLVAYNHPYWSMEDEATILSYEGLFSLEICNYGSYLSNGLEHTAALYDRMLSRGWHINCHGGDDNHNKYPLDDPLSDSFGAFTMICSEELTYAAVVDAMEHGEMYMSMGPRFNRLAVEGETLRVECSEVSAIFVYTGSKQPTAVYAPKGEMLTSAEVPIDPAARYLRVSLRDRDGRWADTRGFFPQEWR